MDEDKREGRHGKLEMLRRTIVILLVVVVVVLICFTAVSHAASVRLRVEYVGVFVDPPLPGGPILCDLRAENSWLHLDYTRASKSESPGPMSRPRHWWGGWSWIETESEPNLRVLLPGWMLIVLLLAYPVHTLIRLVIAKSRRRSSTLTTSRSLVPAIRVPRQPNSLHRIALVGTLSLLALMLSLSAASRRFCPRLTVFTQGAGILGLSRSIEDGWRDFDVMRGLFYTLPFPRLYRQPHTWYGWVDTVQFGNATRYRARIPSWEPIAVLAIYPSVALSGMALRRRRLRQRRARGLCLSCGYNLSGTCPECGQAVAIQSEQNHT